MLTFLCIKYESHHAISILPVATLAVNKLPTPSNNIVIHLAMCDRDVQVTEYHQWIFIWGFVNYTIFWLYRTFAAQFPAFFIIHWRTWSRTDGAGAVM